MKGFNNNGNTCYLNAGLQMVIQNEELCKLVLKYSDKSIILNKFSVIILEYYNKQTGLINPFEIKKIVEKKQEIFRGNGQQDSGEFIMCFLDIIEEEIKKIENDSKEIENIFGINLNCRIKCKYNKCLKIYNNFEITNFLILDLDKNCATLDDLYRKFKGSEILSDENKYHCENCNAKRIISKRYQVIKWPMYLLICLKRFNQSGRTISKQTHPININLSWRHNMSLFGAVIHSGNINGGHYVYVGRQSDNKWYLFNDTNVSEIKTEQELINILNNAYWLMYKMVTV